MNEETLWFEVPEDITDSRLDHWLVQCLPELTRSRIQALAKKGCLTDADGLEVSKLSQTPRPGQRYGITLPPAEPTEIIPEAIPLDILYEDDAVLAVNKPANLVVHPAAGHSHGTLVNALLYYCPHLCSIGGEQRPGIVHRLDKDTSGVIIIAKTDLALHTLAETFAAHTLTKTYTAIVHSTPSPLQGTLDTRIGRSPTNRQKMAILKIGGRQAITHYKVDQQLPNNLSRISCQIETGRTHQIRVHLASLGTPIIGDILYGKSALDHKLPVPPQRQLLHARELIIPHPVTGEMLDIVAPYPDDFKDYL